MKRICGSISDALFEKIEALAEMEGRSVSSLVCTLLENAMDARIKLHRIEFEDSDQG